MPRNTSGLRRGGGRAKGVPNKASREIKQMARELLENPDYLAMFQRRLNSGKLPPAVWTSLYHYGYGKPVETYKLDGPPSLPTIHNHFHAESSSSGVTGDNSGD